MNYTKLLKSLPKDIVNIIGSYNGLGDKEVRSQKRKTLGHIQIFRLLEDAYRDFVSYEVHYYETKYELCIKKDLQRIRKIFEKFYLELCTDLEIRKQVEEQKCQFIMKRGIGPKAGLEIWIHKGGVYFRYRNYDHTNGIWIEEINISEYFEWFYSSLDYCLNCNQKYKTNCEQKDGPQNSDISSKCPHYFCVRCWKNIKGCGGINCPLCDTDISAWLCSHY